MYHYFGFPNDDYFVLFILGMVLILFVIRLIVSLLILKFQQTVSFDASLEFTGMMSRAFFLKNILDIKKTTIGELDKEIRFLPLQFTNFILMPLSMIVSEIIVMSIILSGIILFKFKLFLMLLVTIFPLVGISYSLIRRKIQNLGIQLNNASALSFNHSREMIGGYADIKMQDKSSFFINRLLNAINQYNAIQIKINIYQQIAPKLLEWSALFSVVLIYLYATVFNETKSEIIVVLAVYLASAYRLLPSLNRINSSLLLIKQYEFILDIFEKSKKKLEIEKLLSDNHHNPIWLQHQITLDKIYLSYSEKSNKYVLSGISITIKKGEVIGIVGQSGSGKTSLVYIISGLLPPTKGKILVDDVEINSSNTHKWQKNIAFVYQDIFIINGTVLDNIVFGEEEQNININKVSECLKSVQLYDFVQQLPQGIHTPVGENGGHLSGGQKQRLIIARALYRDASLIIMDEATSALDEQTQESVIQSVYQISKEKNITVILIAHRLSSLKYCNKIIHLENGTITKETSYKEILSKS
ncbi:MAG: protein glycosylation K [Bacteroidia bacterium]|nr:MAG: protein glycosylation K [Bacteroidia bacterium]